MARVEQPVLGLDDEILRVLVVPRMLRELEGAAGEEAAHRPRGARAQMARLEFLAPDRCDRVAPADIEMRARLVVMLARRFACG